MLLRRLILAGLAPLLSLPAFAAAMGSVPMPAHTEAAAQLRAELFSEIWRTVVSLVAVDDATTQDSQKVRTRDRNEYRATFEKGQCHSYSGDHNISLEALTHSPLGRSLWMVQTSAQASAITRRPVFSPLRC